MTEAVSRPLVFVLVREGPSDEGLVPHLRDLIVRTGLASAAVGSARPYKGSTEEKIAKVLAEDATPDCIFVHRDSDSRSAEPRYEEVVEASIALGLDVPCFAVVPIQELEAWLLVDESAIRNVVGRPKGKVPLGIPPLSAIETTASPKEVLRSALLAASETTGRKRDRTRRMFDLHRTLLLERLDTDGAVRDLSAWKRLEADIAAASLVY